MGNMTDTKRRIPVYTIDIIEHCIKEQNFSCAYIQKTFQISYPLTSRILETCEEMAIIKDGKDGREYITLGEWEDSKKSMKTLIEKNLFSHN